MNSYGITPFPLLKGKGSGIGVILIGIMIAAHASPVMPKLDPDPKSIIAIPSHLDPAKLKVVYEDGKYIKWLHENGRTNVSYVPEKYLPTVIKKDETGFVQVKKGEYNLYELPDETSKVVDTISGTEIVMTQEEQKYFNKIKTPRMIVGWVKRDVLKDYAVKKMIYYPVASEKEVVLPDGNRRMDFIVADGTVIGSIPLYTKVAYKVKTIDDIAKRHGSLISLAYSNDVRWKAVEDAPIKDYFVTPLERKNLGNYAYMISEGVVIKDKWQRTISRIYDMRGNVIVEAIGTFDKVSWFTNNGDFYISAVNSFVSANEFNNESIFAREEIINYYRNGVVAFSRRWSGKDSTDTVENGQANTFVLLYTQINKDLRSVELYNIANARSFYTHQYNSKNNGCWYEVTNNVIWLCQNTKTSKNRRDEFLIPVYDLKNNTKLAK